MAITRGWRYRYLHISIVKQKLMQMKLRVAGVQRLHVRLADFLFGAEVVASGTADQVRDVASPAVWNGTGHALINVRMAREHGIRPKSRLLGGVVDIVTQRQ